MNNHDTSYYDGSSCRYSLKAVTEELFLEFNKALQSFCNEERDRIAIYRTLRYGRIRLHVCENTCRKKMLRYVAHKLAF